MSVTVLTPAGSKPIIEGRFRDSGNVLRTMAEGWLRAAAGLKQFYGVLSVALSRLSVTGRGNSGGLITVTTGTVTATPTGGSGSFSYLWTRTAADAQPWTINSPAAATTSFSTNCDEGDSFNATFKCTVTDTLTGTTADSVDVAANCHNVYFGGGLGGGGGPYP